jgi:hypothetical protein
MATPVLQYAKAEVISLKEHPQFDEAWVKDRIIADPSILGLGEDVVVKAVEKIQPKAGRLDLLLHDDEQGIRYELEIMLGEVDASHIIRTLEYWDIERKRYPLYDHRAVLVAEKVTGRFLNVIGLFNNAIPVIAIQMTALVLNNQITLQFTKVLDVIEPGGEDDETATPTVDRKYWVDRGYEKSLLIADQCLSILKEVVPSAALKYNQQFVGLMVGGSVHNFVVFLPKKQFLSMHARIEDPPHWKGVLEEKGIFVTAIREGRIRLRITAQDVTDKKDVLEELFAASYKENS